MSLVENAVYATIVEVTAHTLGKINLANVRISSL